MAKQYSNEFKEKLVRESIETGNVYMVARNYDVAESTLHQWVSKYKKFGSVSLKDVDIELKAKVIRSSHTSNDSATIQENDSLKKLLGEKELEIKILKDLLKKTNPQLYSKLK